MQKSLQIQAVGGRSRVQLRFLGLSILFTLIALLVLSALARLVGMAVEGFSPQDASPDNQHYLNHLGVSLLYLIPGTLFVLLAPLQFKPQLRQPHSRYHRRMGYLIWGGGMVAAGTGLWMNLYWPPVGGPLKWVSSVGCALLMLFALLQALQAILRRNIIQHRHWMIRTFAISLGLATMRLFMIPYFILFGMPSNAIIDAVTLAGFLINALIAEAFIRRNRHP